MSSPFAAGENPYQSPGPPSAAGGFDSSNDDVSQRVVELLLATRPWVRLMGILLFITAGLMTLGSLFVTLAGLDVMAGVAMAAVYLFIAVLFYLIPGVYLFRYASRISDLEVSRSLTHLENALEAQKTFWKYLGIVVLVVIGLYVCVLLIAVVAALIGML